ncbi:hypothetical protein PsorP6_005180 [Peronosclerospora sorghi]|uniref:Uncharacterized protein n=1 Tax=Peronosclerospora sorghi TaxID=230839 RepID=A0ACC0W6E4_9STRA|nr:hypothetical protein PsorP6_005180 [Peronosclerospora sorghi]
MSIARHHLTIHEKNQLCVYHRERPELTQEQLRDWIHEKFGKWIGRSTIGKIASTPEEVCANPAAKRIQSGRFSEMDAAEYEGFQWTKANEIIARLRGSSTRSVSLGWVQRFKKRHSLHRSHSVVKCASAPLEQTVKEHPVEPASLKSTGVVGAKRIREVDEQEQDDEQTEDEAEVSCARMCDLLREQSDFTLVKTAGVCQARVALLLDHLGGGNVSAFRKSGTPEEYERKRDLLVELQARPSAYAEFQLDLRKKRGNASPLLSMTEQREAAVAHVGDVAAASVVQERNKGEVTEDGQRRFELLELKLERKLAEQRRHADEQVRQLEHMQRAQLEAQQNQHAQLLVTILQHQAMMLDLIKSVTAQCKKS